MYVIFRRTTSPCQNQQELRSFSSWCRTTAAFVWVPGARSQACLSSRWNGFSRRVLVRLRRKGTAMNHNRCVSCCVFGARFHVDRLSPSLSRDPPPPPHTHFSESNGHGLGRQNKNFHFTLGWNSRLAELTPQGPFNGRHYAKQSQSCERKTRAKVFLRVPNVAPLFSFRHSAWTSPIRVSYAEWKNARINLHPPRPSGLKTIRRSCKITQSAMI